MSTSGSYSTEMASDGSPNTATGIESNGTNPYDNKAEQLDLKASTMSTSGSYSAEMASYGSPNTATGIESHIMTEMEFETTVSNSESLSGHYDNAATGQGEHINSGYTRITDIGLEFRNKDETEEEQYESIKEEKKKATCRRQICVIVIASIVVIAGSGIGVWRIFVRNDNDRPNIVPPKQDYYVRRGDDVSMHYTINLVNPREVRLLKETPYGNNTLFSVNLTNDALQTMLNDQVNVSIYVKDAEIEVKVSISSTKCLHDGTYYIMIISDTNGFKHSRSNLRVLSECPCRLEFNISSIQDIKCSFPDADNTSIVITKASGDNSMILANYSDITRPSNIPNTKGFSASWLPNGTLVVEIRLGQINCTHEGYYNVNLTMNDITRMHDIFVHVIDHPEEPRLSVLEGGITKDKNWGQMLCSAITGCTKTQFILEYQPNEDQWIKWPSSYTTKFEPNRWYSESFINITEFEINTIDKKKFRCSYKANEKTFTSDTLCVRVIPEGFCMNNTGCNYEHPYFCSKFITCTSVAEERSCPLGLHFLYKGNCGGNCKYRTDQYQRDCNGYCYWPQNVNCTKPTNYCD